MDNVDSTKVESKLRDFVDVIIQSKGIITIEISPDFQRCTWKKDGAIHREGNLPAVFTLQGEMEWWKEGKLHRKGKPAVRRLMDGYWCYFWYEDGECIPSPFTNDKGCKMWYIRRPAKQNK